MDHIQGNSTSGKHAGRNSCSRSGTSREAHPSSKEISPQEACWEKQQQHCEEKHSHNLQTTLKQKENEKKTAGKQRSKSWNTSKLQGNFTSGGMLEETLNIHKAPENFHTASQKEQAEAKAKQIWMRNSTGGLHAATHSRPKRRMRKRQQGKQRSKGWIQAPRKIHLRSRQKQRPNKYG